MPFSLPDLHVAEAPEWIKQRLEEIKTNSGTVRREEDIALDLPGNIAAAKQGLKARVDQGLIAISGQGGNDCTYKTFCFLRDKAVSEGVAIALIEEHFNPHCLPPWSRGELETLAHNAFAYAKNDAGAWATGEMREVFADLETRKTAVADLELIPFSSLINENVGPVEEVLAPYLERGLPNFLVGHGGSHKSRLALQMGMCVAAVADLFGQSPQRAHLVYLSSEDDRKEIIRRMQKISRRLALPVDNATLIDRCGKLSPLAIIPEGGMFTLTDFYRDLLKALKGIAGHKLIVLDSCLDFVAFLNGRTKIDEAAVNAFVKGVLQSLCDEGDATMLVIWHTSKSGRDDGSGWSVAWENAPRSRMLIKPSTKMKDGYELTQVKRNHGPLAKPLLLTYDDGAILPPAPIVAAENSFEEWVIREAAASATRGVPFKAQSIPDWVFERAEELFGRRPDIRQFANVLSKAARYRRLKYVPAGTPRIPTGYHAYDGEEPVEVRDE